MYYNANNLNYAKAMRSNMTPEERKLWYILRAKRFYGFKFKRQVLIGDYIADFVCEEMKIIIEADGGQHNSPENITSDKKRAKYLINQGYKVIRFWNNDIKNNFEGVCEVIKQSLFNE